MKSKSKKYEYIEEKNVDDIYLKKNNQEKIKNEIEEMFDDMIIYN